MSDSNKLEIDIPLIAEKLVELLQENDATEEEWVNAVVFVALCATHGGGDRDTFMRSLILELEAKEQAAKAGPHPAREAATSMAVAIARKAKDTEE